MILLHRYENQVKIRYLMNPFIREYRFDGFKIYHNKKFFGNVVDSNKLHIKIKTIYTNDLIPFEYDLLKKELYVG